MAFLINITKHGSNNFFLMRENGNYLLREQGARLILTLSSFLLQSVLKHAGTLINRAVHSASLTGFPKH